MTNYLDILHQYFGYASFRGIQQDIIESIGSGRDTLGLMPTGGGKSITFQVPALSMEGVCIVITPLIALMKDQVYHLQQRGIKAAAVYTGMSRQEILKVLENSIFGGYKFLYVSPERISSDIFKVKLQHMKVSFITVDEAHCISQWGYDFRPAYLQIAELRKLKPDAPILALTATATPEVVDDIQDKLLFKARNVFRMSFERKNLIYVVRNTTNKFGELIHILNAVSGSAIVYSRTRKSTKVIAQLLLKEGIDAVYFHAGLDTAVKDTHQRMWQQGEKRVIVATNAFGMGIDKADVRLVIHYDCPDSLEAYFQEAGRAGRDGRKAYAVMLYNDSDKHKLERRIAFTYPEKDFIKDVYEHLAYYYQIGMGSGRGETHEFNIDRFCAIYHYFPLYVDSALKILQQAGYIYYDSDPDSAARVRFLIGRNELYLLENMSPHEEAVVTALLRNYSGLFTDYSYIDEGLIAMNSGLTSQQVYIILTGLSQRHIIHFIPQRKVPTISYTQDREETARLRISRDIYENRKEQYVKRIKAVEAYATNDRECRSRQLLRYFGETDVNDCNHCDVCLERKTDQLSADRLEGSIGKIMELLRDGEPHFITEILRLGLPTRQLEGALQYLVAEEKIEVSGSSIRKS